MTAQISDQTTVAAKLAAKLENSDMGVFLDEEDVDALAREAIKKAFFQERTEGSQYNRVLREPLIVEMASDKFREAIRKAAEPLAEEIVKSEAFGEALTKAVLSQIPQVAEGMAYNLVTSGLRQSVEMSYEGLGQALRDKLSRMRERGEL